MKRKVLCNILFLLAAIIMGFMGTMGTEIHARESSPFLHKRILDNSITTIVKEVPGSKVATVQLWVKAGSVYEEPGEEGITHLIEHMIFKGTTSRGPGELAETIESVGGQLNAYTSYEYTVYHATLSASHWELAMDLLTDAVLNSTFDPEELEREKKVVLEEISMRNDRPEINLFEAMMSQAYLRHPYRRPVIGTVESVSGISREDILAYRQNHYQPENLTVVVVGDVQAEQVIAKVKELMAGLERRNYEQPSLPEESSQEEVRFFTLERDINQTHLALALPVTRFNHPDSVVFDIIAQIIGQGEASRLHHRLRDQMGLVYRIDASSFTPRDRGVFSISAVLSVENAAAALEAALEELFNLKYQAVGEEELERAKRNMESDFVFNLERVEGQARVLGAFEFISGDPREDEYLDRIRAVSREDIQRVAATYFQTHRITAGLLVPAGAALDLDQSAVAAIARRADDQARQVLPSSLVPETFLPDVHRFELNNGTVLLVRENPRIPTVSIRVVFPGGLQAETAATNGSFAFISQMLPKGTAKMDAREISLHVANMAGDLSGFNGKNTFGLQADFLSRFFEPGLELIRDIIREPVFSVEEMEKVRPELLSRLRQQKDSLPALAFKEFNERLFHGHPYGLNSLGSEAALARLTAAELKTIYDGQALPENMVIAVAGQVKAEEVRAAVVELFGDWISPPRPKRRVQEEILPPLAPAAPEIHAVVRDREQLHMVIGFLGVSLASRDRYGLEIIDTLLSGQSGRLFTELRDKQSLAYSLSSFSLLGLDTGSFGVYIGTSPEKREEAKEAVWRELLRLREEPVSAESLQRAKNILISRYELGLQTHGAQAMDLALTETYGLGHDFGNRYITELSKVNIDEVQKIARKLITPEHYIMVTVGADGSIPATEPAASGGKE